jgi:hypothetical protein
MARRGASTTGATRASGVWQPLAVEVGLGRYIERKGKPPLYQGPVPYDLRASFVSLLVCEGRTMLEVAAQAGHGIDVCEILRPDLGGLRPSQAHQRGGRHPGGAPG